MKIKDKKDSNIELLGFAVMRYPSLQTSTGYVYPYGDGSCPGRVAVLDEAGYFDYRTIDSCIFLERGLKVAVIEDSYPEHHVFAGQIVGYVDAAESCSYKLVQSYNNDSEQYFRVSASKLRVFFPRWTRVAYRYLGEGEPVQENRYTSTPIFGGLFNE